MRQPGRFPAIAGKVAAHLGDLVPAGFEVAADDDQIVLFYQGDVLRDWLGLSEAEDPDASVQEMILQSVWQILEDFQDDIIEILWAAWPPVPDSAGPARAYARVENGQLRWGYTGAIDLPPIAI